MLNHVYSYAQPDGRRRYVNPADVRSRRDAAGAEVFETTLPGGETIRVEYQGLGKMSKSENNGVDPEGLVKRLGADTARLFTMFASPPDQTLEWSDEGAQGASRFIRRLWNAVYEHVSRGLPPGLDTGTLTDGQREVASCDAPCAREGYGRHRPASQFQHCDCRQHGASQHGRSLR